ncbi:MAG: prepilin-type N-terminal cleavage/methylation domain-containing protein [Phycisphaerae bacterium]|nr:prepilin-type N-terminal cleavage/methylation domain-containing protein [Phycisphaerae bacterium]
MNRRYSSRHGAAFTLMELLVVIAIISMLVMILAPGLNKVMKSAKALKQKAVLHSLEVGLEFFHDENDGYPQSKVESNKGAPPLICGAQHLAEALLGRDQRGFDPVSKWYAPKQDSALKEYENDPTSLHRRKKVYTELKDSAVVLLEQLYEGYSGPVYSSDGTGKILAPVITDIFRHRKVVLPSGQQYFVGNPILYYKANEESKDFEWDPMPTNLSRLIYNYDDNADLIKLGPVQDPVNRKHLFDPAEPYEYTDIHGAVKTATGRERFYNTITDPSVQNYRKPYNPRSFILMSAGYDGIFGTKDDVTNFNY